MLYLESFNDVTWSKALSFYYLYVIRAFYIHYTFDWHIWNSRKITFISKNILLDLIPCEIRVSHGHIISSYLYILYIQIKHVEISNCQSFHHQSNTTFFLKCISFRRGSSIGKKRKMCAFRNMFLCYVTITDMSLTVKNASSDVEFDISEYFIYIRW